MLVCVRTCVRKQATRSVYSVTFMSRKRPFTDMHLFDDVI